MGSPRPAVGGYLKKRKRKITVLRNYNVISLYDLYKDLYPTTWSSVHLEFIKALQGMKSQEYLYYRERLNIGVKTIYNQSYNREAIGPSCFQSAIWSYHSMNGDDQSPGWKEKTCGFIFPWCNWNDSLVL